MGGEAGGITVEGASRLLRVPRPYLATAAIVEIDHTSEGWKQPVVEVGLTGTDMP